MFKKLSFPNISHTVVEIRNNAQSEISTILGEELQRVNNNVFCKYKK